MMSMKTFFPGSNSFYFAYKKYTVESIHYSCCAPHDLGKLNLAYITWGRIKFQICIFSRALPSKLAS